MPVVSKFAILSLVPACQPVFPLFETCCLISAFADFHNIPQFLSPKARAEIASRGRSAVVVSRTADFRLALLVPAAAAPQRSPGCPGAAASRSPARSQACRAPVCAGLALSSGCAGGSGAAGSPSPLARGQSCPRGQGRLQTPEFSPVLSLRVLTHSDTESLFSRASVRVCHGRAGAAGQRLRSPRCLGRPVLQRGLCQRRPLNSCLVLLPMAQNSLLCVSSDTFCAQSSTSPRPHGLTSVRAFRPRLPFSVAARQLRAAPVRAACWGGARRDSVAPGRGPRSVPVPVKSCPRRAERLRRRRRWRVPTHSPAVAAYRQLR